MITHDESSGAWFRAYVQAMVQDALGDIDPDEDGDFPVGGERCFGWLVPETTGPGGLMISITVAYGTPDRVGLLREINQVNAAHRAIKIVRHHDGGISATWWLPAEGLSTELIRLATRQVITLADDLGQMITTVYGGYTANQCPRGELAG